MKSIKDRLKAEEQDELIVELRDKVIDLVKGSRTDMSEKYETWDKHNDIYCGVRPLDKDDLEARELNEPEKMVVPMSFAQIQTFVAFCFMLYTQNRRFFEFVPTGSEDDELVKDSETILERDLRRNNWPSKLYQLLLDVPRFGLGILKHWWSVEKQYAPVVIEPSSTAAEGFSFQVAGGTEMQEFTKYEGNRIINVSPYNFFPDTRFPLAEWHKGSFVADETEWHINQLRQWQRDGLAFGVEHIDVMEEDDFRKRGSTRLQSFSTFMGKGKDQQDKDEQIVCVTECQLKIVPAKYELGTEDYPVAYVVTIANDSRVINVRPSGYLHDEWTYEVAQFSPDMHQQVSTSLADTIFPMQEVVSYLINSRLASVRKSLENNVIVDPSGVDMASLESRSPWILMKKGSPKLGVEKFIRQLQFVDTTSKHLDDANMIMQLMQVVTGVNENAMGQFSGGRRSATEARAANSGSSSRMKVPATVIWSDCLQSMGRKMLINHRQGISLDSYTKILGPSAEARYAAFKPQDVSMLVGVEDHFVFDGTLQSEKGFIAQSLQELVGAILSNPLVMQSLPLDVGRLMEKILQLRGIDNIEQFRIQPMLPQGQVMQDGITGTIQGGTQGNAQAGPGVPGNTGLPALPGRV